MQRVSLDRITNLPTPIIENILGCLPIKEAVRTSVLSRNWRSNWTGMPKLVFSEDEIFGIGNPEYDHVDAYERKLKIISAIRQVLRLHQGPIQEFTVSMLSFTNIDIDQVLLDLSRNHNTTLEKLTIQFCYQNGTFAYKLPVSIFSFQKLTNLYFSHSAFEFDPTFTGFGSLSSLYFHSCNASSKGLLHLLSNCPVLKRLKLAFTEHNMRKWEGITFHELSDCLPVIEELSFNCRVIECCSQKYLWRELPNLKLIALVGTTLFDGSHLPLLCHLLRSSPNLETMKLRMYSGLPDDSKLESNMGDCSDMWLKNLKELKISCFDDTEGERRFVKLILAKSPVLKKLIIEVSFEDADRQMELLIRFLQSPRESPASEIIVRHNRQPWNDYGYSQGLGVVVDL